MPDAVLEEPPQRKPRAAFAKGIAILAAVVLAAGAVGHHFRAERRRAALERFAALQAERDCCGAGARTAACAEGLAELRHLVRGWDEVADEANRRFGETCAALRERGAAGAPSP